MHVQHRLDSLAATHFRLKPVTRCQRHTIMLLVHALRTVCQCVLACVTYAVAGARGHWATVVIMLPVPHIACLKEGKSAQGRGS